MNRHKLPSNGLCTDLPGLLYPDPRDKSAVQTAIDLCLDCPAYLACLSYAKTLTPDEDLEGVIAGLTHEERHPDLERKFCPGCDEEKAKSEFGRHSGGGKWLRRLCKACTADRRLVSEGVAA